MIQGSKAVTGLTGMFGWYEVSKIPSFAARRCFATDGTFKRLEVPYVSDLTTHRRDLPKGCAGALEDFAVRYPITWDAVC